MEPHRQLQLTQSGAAVSGGLCPIAQIPFVVDDKHLQTRLFAMQMRDLLLMVPTPIHVACIFHQDESGLLSSFTYSMRHCFIVTA